MRVFYGWYIVAISLVIMTAAYGVYFGQEPLYNENQRLAQEINRRFNR